MALNEAWMLMVKRDLSGEQKERKSPPTPNALSLSKFSSVSHDGIQNTPTTVDRFSDNDIETEKNKQSCWMIKRKTVKCSDTLDNLSKNKEMVS